jgi:hypothetical protein
MKRVLYGVKHLQLNVPFQGNFDAIFNPDNFGSVDSFRDAVHVDEKWVFLTEENLRMYLGRDELGPHRTVLHKSHIEKVMFCCAVARPRFNAAAGICTFDGKIGMWPFVQQRAAVHSSARRPAGTLETIAVKVTKAVYSDMIINKVLPAIKEK